MAMAVTAATMPVWSEVATHGLVVHYRADDADGAGNPGTGELATWTDLALEYGEANNGELVQFKFKPGCGWIENTDQPEDSPFRYGLEFEATHDRGGAYVIVSPPSFVDEDSFTYELWLRADTTEEAPVWLGSLWKGCSLIAECPKPKQSKNSFTLRVGPVDNKLWLSTWPSGAQTTPDYFPPYSYPVGPEEVFFRLGRFVQVVMTKNGKNVWFYVDGGATPETAFHAELAGKYSGAVPHLQTVGCLMNIEESSNPRVYAFNGQMSIVRIYNRPLSREEVAGNYAATMSRPAPQHGRLVMNPATESFTIRDDAGPKAQTISLPAGRTACAGGAPVTVRYDRRVVSIYSDAGATKPVESGGVLTIPAGESAVTVYVKAYSEGSTELRTWTPGVFGARAEYKVDIAPVPGPEGVATRGLVVAYRADDADGAGNPGTKEREIWTDLAVKDGVRNDGRLLHFRFGEGRGWVENADQPEDSPFRYGLEFQATTHYNGDFVSIAPAAPVNQESFTYEFWIKPDTESYAEAMTLIGQYGGNAGNNVLVSGAGGWVRCGPCGPDGGLSGAGSDGFSPGGKYMQLAVTKNGGEVRYYVHGPDTPAKTARVEQPEKYTGPAPDRQCLGTYWANDGRLMNAYNGQMSIVRVYNRALSGEELAGNYAAETGEAVPSWEAALGAALPRSD